MNPSKEVMPMTAPVAYTPAYCEMVRLACTDKMNVIDKKVEKVDSRIWALIILAGSNLLATVGGLLAFIFSLVEMHK